MSAPHDLIYVGTYSTAEASGARPWGRGRGIHRFRLDPATGTLAPAGATEGIDNPSYLALAPSGGVLYCAHEHGLVDGAPAGAVGAFRVDPATGDLTPLNRMPSEGAHPCHLIVHPQGGHVLVANYTSGTTTVLPLAADGSLRPPSCVIRHVGSGPHPTRQAGPHAHAVATDPEGRVVQVVDLGTDSIHQFLFDPAAGRLEPHPRRPRIALPPGAGPRHLAVAPDRRFAYVVNELTSSVTAFRLDPATDGFEPIQTLPALPDGHEGASTCAAIRIAPDGRHLYVSNRGHDSLAAFALDPDGGRMAALGHVPAGGRKPRDFALSPDGRRAIVAHQEDDTIAVFDRDPVGGGLTDTGVRAAVGSPVCVLFA